MRPDRRSELKGGSVVHAQGDQIRVVSIFSKHIQRSRYGRRYSMTLRRTVK